MKKLILILITSIPISIFSQTLNQNPYLIYYLGPYLQESALGTIMGKAYEGIGKIHLAKNIPSTWIGSYSMNHLPISARYADYNTPFGRSYLGTNSGSYNSTDLTFLGSHFGEIEGNISSTYRLKKKQNISTTLLLNYQYYNGDKDKNEDHFLDLNHKNKFFGINSWTFRKGNFNNTTTAYHLNLNEVGGEITFNKDTDYLSTNAYGLGTNLSHTGVAIQNQYVLKNKETNITQGIFVLDAEMRLTDLTDFYGTKEYKGNERLINTYLSYQFSKSLTDYEFGIQFKNDKIEESFADSQMTNNNHFITGIYGRAETKIGYKLKLKSDIRMHYHSLDNFLIHPSIQLSYVPIKNTLISFFAGNGRRNAQIFSENSRYLFTGREVQLQESLQAEKAWHYGMSFKWSPNYWQEIFYNLNVGNFRYYFLFHHNIYQNINYIDLSSDEQILSFKNHNGKAFKTSLNNRITFSPVQGGLILLMHRFDVFKMDINGNMENKLFHPRNSFMLSFKYSFKKYIHFNTNFHLVGKTYTPEKAYVNGLAPRQKRWDIHFTVPLGNYISKMKKFDLILGWDNITSNKVDRIIIGSENPFDDGLDGGIIPGNAVGQKLYGGIKIGF